MRTEKCEYIAFNSKLTHQEIFVDSMSEYGISEIDKYSLSKPQIKI